MSQSVVIAAARRTAVGRLSGTLAGLPATRLGAGLIRATLANHGILARNIDAVVLGQALTAGSGPNPARQAAMHAGLPESVPATTINDAGGSGLAAVIQAVRTIALGEAGLIVAGGQESTSRAPHLLPGSRSGCRLGEWTLIDSINHDGWQNACNGRDTSQAADDVARHYRISRAEQDTLAARSQQRAEQALKHGRFENEVLAVEVPQKAGDTIAFARDEIPRPGVTAERLARCEPAPGRESSVTAGNVSEPGDGAAIVLVTTSERCEALGLEPLARIEGYTTTGVDPALAGVAPVSATRKCLDKIGWSGGDLDLIECHESSAADSIAIHRQLEWPSDRINVNGGAIALGHPIGASGSRILVTLLHEMARRDARRGLAALAAGDGLGIALALRNL